MQTLDEANTVTMMPGDNRLEHNHWEGKEFARQNFTVLDQLRREDVLTDIALVTEDSVKCITVRAHKLVLMAASEYFRTMFKSCFAESDLNQLPLPGNKKLGSIT